MLSYPDSAGKETLTDLAAEAAKKALQMAEVDPDDVDLVLMCTSTPENLLGSAPMVCIFTILCCHLKIKVDIFLTYFSFLCFTEFRNSNVFLVIVPDSESPWM